MSLPDSDAADSDAPIVKCDFCGESQPFAEKCVSCGAPLPLPPEDEVLKWEAIRSKVEWKGTATALEGAERGDPQWKGPQKVNRIGRTEAVILVILLVAIITIILRVV